jgi:AraC-like DNA-binding protein
MGTMHPSTTNARNVADWLWPAGQDGETVAAQDVIGRAAPSVDDVRRTDRDAQWSELCTDAIAADKRFDFWRESFLNFTSPGSRAAVRGEGMRIRRWLASSPSGVSFWRYDASFERPVAIERTPDRCRRDGVDDLFVCCPLQPVEQVAQKDSAAGIRPGQAFLFDTARPWVASSATMHYFGIDLSRHFVRNALGPGIERLAGQALTVDGGTYELLRGHAAALVRCGATLSPTVLQAALDFLRELVIEILCRHGTAELARPERYLLDAAKQQIARRLEDPALDVSSIAAAIGTSRAALYRAFRGEAEGIAAAIAAARLEQARVLLLRDHERAIGDVAFACGFDNPRRFNRLFRQRFGCTPSEARYSQAGGPASSASATGK